MDPQYEVVLSTKVGRRLESRPDANLTQPRQGFVSPEPFESVFDYSYAGVMRSYEESRARLRREVDILYVHDLGRRVHGERHPVLFKSVIPGMSSPSEVSDAQRWLDTGIPNSFWMELRERGLVREDAPLPATP